MHKAPTGDWLTPISTCQIKHMMVDHTAGLAPLSCQQYLKQAQSICL
jgi:hypothetical protein